MVQSLEFCLKKQLYRHFLLVLILKEVLPRRKTKQIKFRENM